jgi:hypothetical protein
MAMQHWRKPSRVPLKLMRCGGSIAALVTQVPQPRFRSKLRSMQLIGSTRV